MRIALLDVGRHTQRFFASLMNASSRGDGVDLSLAVNFDSLGIVRRGAHPARLRGECFIDRRTGARMFVRHPRINCITRTTPRAGWPMDECIAGASHTVATTGTRAEVCGASA